MYYAHAYCVWSREEYQLMSPTLFCRNLSSNFIREIQEYSFSLLTNLTRL